MGCHKKCCKCKGPTGAQGQAGPTGSSGGGGNLLLQNDIGTTVPVLSVINTSGLGGNETFGDNSNAFQIRDLRSLSQFVVGNDPLTSEYQDIPTALAASAANPPALGTFNVIYLQPGIQYVGDITISASVVIRGQEGAAIIGDVTVNGGIAAFFFDTIIVGTVISSGTSTFITSVVNGNSSALVVNGGSINIANSTFINNDLFNPTIVINSGGNIDIIGAVIKNNLNNGYAVRMNNTFQGILFLRSSRLAGGQTYFIQGSTIMSNSFESQSPITLFLDASPQLGITFSSNDVTPSINITKENSNTNATILITNNNIADTMGISVQNNLTASIPHIQIRNNTIFGSFLSTTFDSNSATGTVIFDNNYIRGDIAHNRNSGTPGIVSMSNNRIEGALTYTNLIAELSNNSIIVQDEIPFSLTYNQAAAVDHILFDNILSTTNTNFHTVFGDLSGAAHRLILSSNRLTTNGVQDLFNVSLAGGSTFLTDDQNDNINSSPAGTAFSGSITTL
jgi:hypothetical protein